jgi:septal ring factor EnvC (AmiA/AmiB activator)
MAKTRGRTAAWLCCLLFVLLHPVHAADSAQEEARLQKLRARIGTLQEKLNETRGQRDAVREEVRDLERRIGGLLQSLRQTEARLRRNERKLQDLRVQATRERSGLVTQQQQLGRQIRAAYAMGRQEYPKMLLNQESPSGVARMLTYYQYLNRARAERISDIQARLSRLAALDIQIREQNQELEALRTSLQEQKSLLEVSRARRGELLARLRHEVRAHSQEIERLQADEKRLEQLIDELKTVLPEATPLPSGKEKHFAKLQGRLPLPVRGRIIARYGEQKNVGNLKWRGLFIAGHEGENVIAVFRGRVVFADWLRGFGLLLILDHGDGYMTLYGHNQSLYRGVGDWVEAGETIASLGNTGDVAQPGLYFEIRQNGDPRDPLIWCKAR